MNKTKKVLVTVKAYPYPSGKHGETVCCAGIDLDSYRLIRLYPIPYRDLYDNQRFPKYSIIEASCFPSNDDSRPESFKVDPDSIKIIRTLDTKDKWKERKDIMSKVSIKTMCQVLKDVSDYDFSLGFIKPDAIDFKWAKDSISDRELQNRNMCYAQLSLFNKQKRAIEPIPFKFYYTFKCPGNSECEGHKLSIIDWEMGQAFRNFRSKYEGEQLLLEKLKEKWLGIANTEKNDVYFFVGNMKRIRENFMVLGVFYPKK